MSDLLTNQLGQANVVVSTVTAGNLGMVASYQMKRALLNAGVFSAVRDARSEPPDEFTLRWDSSAPVVPNDVVATTIQTITGYTPAQMMALFSAASLVP